MLQWFALSHSIFNYQSIILLPLFCSDKNKIIYNRQCGHMLRTKLEKSNEGGVAAGSGALDSPYLYDDWNSKSNRYLIFCIVKYHFLLLLLLSILFLNLNIFNFNRTARRSKQKIIIQCLILFFLDQMYFFL